MRKLILLMVLSSLVPLSAQRPHPSHAVVDQPRPRPGTVAVVNGVALTSERLAAALNELLPFESFHSRVTPARTDQLRRQALDRIIDEELQYQEGVRLGVGISEQRLEQEVLAVQSKYGTRGALLAALGRSESTMAELRQELRRTLTVDEAVRRAVTATCQVTRADASAFFAANPDRFVVPEEMHVYAITIGVEPSASPAQWSAAKARAEELRLRIEAGASFEETARTFSTDPSRATGGDMGFMHRGSMVDEFEAATREVPLGKPSAPVQSLYGYHLVQVAEIRPPRRQTFAEVAVGLEKDLTATRCEEAREAWIATLRKQGIVVLLSDTI
jgi:peptidyl-prolyl cis-trans isomerase C